MTWGLELIARRWDIWVANTDGGSIGSIGPTMEAPMSLVSIDEFTRGEGESLVPAQRIAVILPCLDEAAAVAGVIAGFQAAMPGAEIFVIDNGSTDGTSAIAREAGANVLLERAKGKGNAVRRAFAAIDADVYMMADGDGTYDAARAPDLVGLLLRERLDMVVGARRKIASDIFRTGHELGNQIFNRVLQSAFHSEFHDVFSGYRVFSNRYVKSFPSLSDGFEIETEMTVHAIMLKMPVAEVECDYRGRTAGTFSKLNTYGDGWRIALAVTRFFRVHRPLAFFGVFSVLLFAVSGLLFYPVFIEYLHSGLVPRMPSLLVSVALAAVAVVMAGCGVILDAMKRMQLEIRRLLYLNAPREVSARNMAVSPPVDPASPRS